MAANTVIVLNELAGLKFWTGSRWSGEYPDAKKYTARDAERVMRTDILSAGVYAVTNYGCATEFWGSSVTKGDAL